MLADLKVKPDLVFASSGGSVCAFIDWDPSRVPLVLEKVTSSFFIKEWNVPLFKHLYSLYQGSVYNKGDGGRSLFLNLFDSKKIQQVETWLGAYVQHVRRVRTDEHFQARY